MPPAVPPRLPDVDGSATERLAALAAAAEACRQCRLGSTRTQAVFSDGDPAARIVFCGEGPGADEDRIGRPFVGRAGELLTRIIEGAMGMPRESVYIANIVKCRPPQNRNPEPDEQAACLPFLRAQLDIVRPDLIIALGKIAAHALLRVDPKTPMGRLRGRVHEVDGLRILPTWHPAYLLRNPAAKSQTWDDIKVALRFLGLPERPAPHRRG
ncbi:MAG: uracil-DNA glycosylase [Planctomycetes bacterium]|nr:uracil-DNA glycosylase [Planctomycetota bacterium]MCB9918127.1 uracil-DNA glycosylase [Planctomycetota bacterium]